MGPIGLPEMMGIFVIALLLFGPKKLPELGRTLGKALSEFRRAKNELKSTFESHLQELERETRIDLSTPKLESPSYTPSNYSYPYETDSVYGSTPSPHGESTAAIAVASEPPLPYGHPLPGTVARSNGVAPSAPELSSTAPDHAAASEDHPS